MKTLILLITQIIFLFPYLIHSQSEALDITFGNNGIVQTDVGGDLDVVHTILLQPDGKILIGGYYRVISGNFLDWDITDNNF